MLPTSLPRDRTGMLVLTLQAFPNPLETGDGNFFDVQATPVRLFHNGSTPGVRLSSLIVDEHPARR